MKIALIGKFLDERHDAAVAVMRQTAAQYKAETTGFETLLAFAGRDDLTSWSVVFIGETQETLDELNPGTAALLSKVNSLGYACLVRDEDDSREPTTDGPILYIAGDDFGQLVSEIEDAARIEARF